MMDRKNGRRRVPRLSAELRHRQSVRPLELFFDLVFVLGFTQCTALIAADPTWAGIGRGMMVLAMLWWAWVCYAWLTSVIEPEEGSVRLVMFAVMAALLVVAYTIPEAFGDRALGFALVYGLVRWGHVALFVLVSRDDPVMRRSVLGFAIGTSIAIGLLVWASFLSGGAQVALWLIAILIDWGDGFFGVGNWRLVPAHFAERHNLVIILALGESVIALGVGVDLGFTPTVIAAAVLGIGLASALWWIYFDVVALVTERRLMAATPGRERNALARDSYSYLHFPMVAGIVLGALGMEATLAHVDAPLDSTRSPCSAARLFIFSPMSACASATHAPSTSNVLCLLAFALIRWRRRDLYTVVAVNVLLWAMIAFETLYVYDERRYQLRHDMEIEIPGRR